jgi:cobalt-zinc-cadmium efflux system outer membrane protein
MRVNRKWLSSFLLLFSAHSLCEGQSVSPLTEDQVLEQFRAQSPQARELAARITALEAETRSRSLYTNPSVSYSREGAGYNTFLEASQTLPLSGRLRYLREAGAAAISAAGASREATLWSLRSDVRAAFYRLVASQERVRVLSAGQSEVERLVAILRRREDEGEGSRYDRLRASREITELRADLASAQSFVAAAAAGLTAFLPESIRIQTVDGQLAVTVDVPELAVLLQRASTARADYRAAQQTISRYQSEEQAARRLRLPEPQVTAGMKRADTTSGVPPSPFSNLTRTGLAISVSVPLPIFNDGRYEVARYRADREQADAHSAVLLRQIRAEIQGARDVLAIRREALVNYQREIEATGSELTRITQVAFEEGEIGILQLLDSLRVTRAARLRLIDLQAGVKDALIELERAVGEEFASKEARP